MTWEGIIPRKRRKLFEQFLEHKDRRIRERAEEMRKEDHAERACLRAMRELEDEIPEDELPEQELIDETEEDSGQTEYGEHPHWTDELRALAHRAER